MSRGSSLVEVIVSLFILSVLVIGLFPTTNNIILSNQVSREISLATGSANMILEELRLLDYEYIISGSTTCKNGFIISWQVTDHNNYKHIRVTVMDRAITMETMVAKNE